MFGQKSPKPAKGGAFPRLVESTPPVLGVPASLYRRPLARWGHIDGVRFLWVVPTSGGSWYFYCQGLTLVCSCSQLPVVWLYHASGLLQAQRPPCVKGAVSRKADGGIDLLQCLRRNPAPPPGTLRWGDFCSGKSHQNPLPLLWLLSLPPHQATLGSWPYHQVVSTSGPPLGERRSRRRRPGPRKLETAAHQGKALTKDVPTT